MARASDAIVRVVWAAAAVVCAFTIENIWMDPWLARRSHHRLPSFVPDSLGTWWYLVLLALAIGVLFLVVCQVLLVRAAGVRKRDKIWTGVAVLAAAGLAGGWFVRTGGMALARQSPSAGSPGKRSVVLRWKASTTPGVRYNVYRGPSSRFHPDKLNSTPIDGTTFTDSTVLSGQSYWYVVKAVNAKGEESQESEEMSATIP
jgi:hypothetical protein